MKYGILTVFLLMVAVSAGAQEVGGKLFDPDEMRIVVPYQTQTSFSVRQPSFKPSNIGSPCLRFLERISSCEYDLIPAPRCTLQLALDPERQGVTTRLKLFNRPIYLTFFFSD
jgi:hypothetical protein